MARGLRRLGAAFAVLCVATAAVSLLVGVTAGVSLARALSGGFLVVGSLLFIAGALTGLRDPSRSLRPRRVAAHGRTTGPATWTEAFHLSALLVWLGVCLVVVGIVIHPRASF